MYSNELVVDYCYEATHIIPGGGKRCFFLLPFVIHSYSYADLIFLYPWGGGLPCLDVTCSTYRCANQYIMYFEEPSKTFVISALE